MNIEMTRGDTTPFNVNVVGSNLAPEDLTDSKIWFTVKAQYADPDIDAIIALNSEDDPTQVFIVDDPLNGHAQIVINPTDTDDITRRTVYYYDVQLKTADGKITTVVSGKLTVNMDATIVTV